MGYMSECKSVASIGWAEDQGSRPEMEDSFVVVDCFDNRQDNLFACIYDGHGGTATVEFLIEALHLIVKENLYPLASHELEKKSFEETDIIQLTNDAIKQAFVQTDKIMIASGVVESGATACMCLIRTQCNQRILYCAHLGDSRAVIGRRNGTVERLTSRSDHKASNIAETQWIEASGGFVCNERVNGMLAVSRAFGDAELKKGPCVVSNEPSIRAIPLDGSEELIIMACDGIWDVMNDDVAVKLVHEVIEELKRDFPDMTCEEASEVLARALAEEAITFRESPDNVTVLVILLDDMGFIKSSAFCRKDQVSSDNFKYNLKHKSSLPCTWDPSYNFNDQLESIYPSREVADIPSYLTNSSPKKKRSHSAAVVHRQKQTAEPHNSISNSILNEPSGILYNNSNIIMNQEHIVKPKSLMIRNVSMIPNTRNARNSCPTRTAYNNYSANSRVFSNSVLESQGRKLGGRDAAFHHGSNSNGIPMHLPPRPQFLKSQLRPTY